jgi:hypothetical protein
MGRGRWRRLAVLVAGLVAAQPAAATAYELITHTRITVRAASQSLGFTNYLNDLGISPLDKFDTDSITQPYQLGWVKQSGEPLGWLVEGSIREDDFRTSFPSCPQVNNPEANTDRPKNHFLDVQREPRQGLDATFLLKRIQGYAADGWALGSAGRSENEFTILDARTEQWKSLTEPTKSARDVSTARLFRTLGQVIHVVQDMAQPQHTRNDPHVGCLFGLALGRASVYEKYLDELAVKQRVPLLLGNNQPYPSPPFTTYQDFWTTPRDASQEPVPGRQGLADFSSRNFFSVGTNLVPGCTGLYNAPPCRLDAYIPQVSNRDLFSVDGTRIPGAIVFFTRDITDTLTGQLYTAVPVSAGSIVDRHLAEPVLSLNKINYDAMAAILLPRAVGYSAGLLDYFFRGRLEGEILHVEGPPASIESPPYGGELSLTNRGPEPMEGTFRLYVDRPTGIRDLLVEWTGQTFQPGVRRILPFSVPTGFGAVAQFVVAFQGRMGAETSAVAGAVVHPAQFWESFTTGPRGDHVWAHTDLDRDLFVQTTSGTATTTVTGGRLVKENLRFNGNSSQFHLNESYIGPVGFAFPTPTVLRTFQDVFSVPITSRTMLFTRFNSTITAQPSPTECNGDTCAWQVLEFHFSGRRIIQFSTAPLGVVRPGHRVASYRVQPDVPVQFNIYNAFTRAGIDTDNLVLGSITTQQMIFTTIVDQLTRVQRMEVDYIGVVDLDLTRDSDRDGILDNVEVAIGLNPQDPGDAGPRPSIRIDAPVQSMVLVVEGTVVALQATATSGAQVAAVEFIVNGFPLGPVTSPPYVGEFIVPSGVSAVTIEATVTDIYGRTATATRTLTVIPDPPPTVVITSPASGAVVIEGSELMLNATATDNGQVSQFFWTVNGVDRPSIATPPYQTVITVPVGATSLTVQATATDDLGQITVTARTITVVPDPDTTVVGRVVTAQGAPVASAVVTVFGQFHGTSATDGTFAIPGVPTIRRLSAVAKKTVGTTTLQGASAPVAPAAGGTTSVGSIVVRPVAVSFYPGSRVPVGTSPNGIAVADLNRDGRADVVTVNASSNDVSIVLGNGDGTFQPARSAAVGRFPEDLAVADLNRDGVPDIVTVNGLDNNVSVLLGNGDGTFQPQRRYATGDAPALVLVGDFNGDGIADIVAANFNGFDVSVLLGNGDGTFQLERRTPSVGDFLQAIGAADLNRDGRLDLVVGAAGGVFVFLGNGDGTFQAPRRLAGGATSVTLADVNGDGIPDLVASDDPQTVSVRLGQGDGTFQSPRRVAVDGFGGSVLVTDVNGDGKPDLVVNTGDLAVFLGNGDGTFEAPLLSTGGGLAIAVADFNGDGVPDVVAVRNALSTGGVVLSLGNGDGTFSSALDEPGGDDETARGIAVGDLNGDGKLDVVVTNRFGRSVSILVGHGDGSFQPRQFAPAGAGAISPTLADLNRDGKLDVITANRDSNSVSVLLGNGDGTFQPPQEYATRRVPIAAAVADLNGDGIPDIVVANQFDNSVSVLRGNGDGSFQDDDAYSVGLRPVSVAIADVNGDGIPDIVVANSNSDSVAILLGFGDGTFDDALFIDVGDGPESVVVADLNGDGIPDIVTANANSRNVSVVLGTGGGLFGPEQRFAVGVIPRSVAVADLNGDGILDIVTSNMGSGDVSVLFGNGDGTFQPQQSFAADFPLSVTVADVNGDGAPDLVVLGPGRVIILLHK